MIKLTKLISEIKQLPKGKGKKPIREDFYHLLKSLMEELPNRIIPLVEYNPNALGNKFFNYGSIFNDYISFNFYIPEITDQEKEIITKLANLFAKYHQFTPPDISFQNRIPNVWISFYANFISSSGGQIEEIKNIPHRKFIKIKEKLHHGGYDFDIMGEIYRGNMNKKLKTISFYGRVDGGGLFGVTLTFHKYLIPLLDKLKIPYEEKGPRIDVSTDYLDPMKEFDQTEDQDLAYDDRWGISTIDEYDVNASVEDDEQFADNDFWGDGLGEIKNLGSITTDTIFQLLNTMARPITGGKMIPTEAYDIIEKYRKKNHLSSDFYSSTIKELPQEDLASLYSDLSKLKKSLDEFYTDDLDGEEIYGS